MEITIDLHAKDRSVDEVYWEINDNIGILRIMCDDFYGINFRVKKGYDDEIEYLCEIDIEQSVKMAKMILLFYDKQLNSPIIEAESTIKPKTSIHDFLYYKGLEKEFSVRLRNILLNAFNSGELKYVEDINVNSFMSIRNAGKSSWTEFCEIRSKGL